MPLIHIDPRTVILLAGVMSGFMAVILYFLKRSYPPAIHGLGEWSLALVLVFLAMALATGYGALPEMLSVNLPRLLLPSGLLLAYVGTHRFFGLPYRVRPWLYLIAGVVLGQMWFTLVVPSFQMRLIFSAVLGAFLLAAFANLLRKQGLSTVARRLSFGVLAAMSLVQVVRLISAFSLPLGANVLDISPLNIVYVASFSFFIVLFSVCLVLLAAERLHAEVAYLASHDSLTNALTRRHFNEVCMTELERSQRHGYRMALLVMDLDHFKAINDSFGHQRGDRVLTDFVSKVNGLLRRPDQLGRFGGEEFVALLPQTSLEEALVVAERIREACAVPGTEPSCTVSIGVTTNHTEGDNLDALIARADAAMYRAKTLGRNRVESA